MKSKFIVDFGMGIGSNSVKYMTQIEKVDHQVYRPINLSSYLPRAMKLYETKYHFPALQILPLKNSDA